MEMITTRSDLMAYLKKVGYAKTNYSIAVEGLIFTKEGKLILEKRGKGCRDEVGKLEGVGGRFDDDSMNLHQALQEEIQSEVGPNLHVEIDRILEVRDVQFLERGVVKDWLVVSFLCHVVNGKPIVGEPHKIDAIVELFLDDLFTWPEEDLSRSTVQARKVYQRRYGNHLYWEVPVEAE